MPKIIAFTKTRNNSSIDDLSSALPQAREPQRAGQTSDENDPAQQLAVSVVVPTCGRPALLTRCLAALVLQRYDTSRFEIIVVDDRPDPKTRDIVFEWALHGAGHGLAISYIPSPGPHGPAAARNFGWRAARGNIIAFTDDDTVARPDWLEKGMQAFDDGHVDAVRGRIVMPLNHEPTDYELDAKWLERAEFVTANCFCRKSLLEKLGGFDERFRFAWREDSDLHFKLLEAGVHIRDVPSAVIVHPIRPAQWGVSLSQQKKVQFDVLLYKKHPQLYRQRIRAHARWDYYLTVLALVVAAGAALAGQFAAASIAAAVWLALTARFCLMRLGPTVKTPAHIGEMVVTSALIPPVAVFWRMVGIVKFRAALF